jgi:hypothetical protein
VETHRERGVRHAPLELDTEADRLAGPTGEQFGWRDLEFARRHVVATRRRSLEAGLLPGLLQRAVLVVLRGDGCGRHSKAEPCHAERRQERPRARAPNGRTLPGASM